MESILNEVIDIDDSLDLFNYNDLYSSSIAFFRSMKYPVSIFKDTANLDTEKFIYLIVKNRIHFSQTEKNMLENVDSISYLFELNKECQGLKATKSYNKTGLSINSIVFLAVDLGGSTADRSYNAYNLNQILNKCYSSPVIILYRHDECIMLAGQELTEVDRTLQVYLSDWYSTNVVDMGVVTKLCDMSFENHSSQNFLDMYYDMLWSFSRSYSIYSESIEFIKSGLLLSEHVERVYDPVEKTLVSLRDVKPVSEKLEEKQLYYQKLYGYDYVLEAEQIQILPSQQDSDSLFLFMSEFENEDNLEAEFFDFSSMDSDGDDDVEDIDESYFDDPIMLLKFLDEKDSK